jgi:hypothetical protein
VLLLPLLQANTAANLNVVVCASCSNGHICLDILYDGQNGGWSPALTINKVCLSLRSMLASNTDKVGVCVWGVVVVGGGGGREGG